MDHGESIFINQRSRSDYHVSNLYPNALDSTTDKTFLCSEGSLPVEEACNVLINNNISSAPVYDAQVKEVSETSIVHARSYVGMFDYGDVIAYILLVLQNMPPPGDEGEESDSQARENLTFEIKDIVRRALEGEDVPVKLASGKFCINCNFDQSLICFFLITDLSQKNPFYSIMPEATLLSAVEEFAYGTHRGNVFLVYCSTIDVFYGYKFNMVNCFSLCIKS